MRHPTFLECYHSFQRIYNGGGGHLCAGDSPNMVEKQGQMLSSIRPPSVPPPTVIWAPCSGSAASPLPRGLAARGTQRRRLLLTTALEVGQKPPAGSQSLCTTDSTAVSVYTMEGRLFACSTGGNPNLENQKRVLKSLHRNIHPAWGAPSNRKVVQSTLGTGTKSEPERCS